MKLVQFEKSKSKSIFINPERVNLVTRYNSEKTMIYYDNSAVVVLHNVDYVVRKLTELELE
jgi:hypothetical protein